MKRKIKSPGELAEMRERFRKDINLREGVREICVNVHMGTCGIAAGARDILIAVMEELEAARLEDVTVRQSGCPGLCDSEPVLTLIDREGREFRYGNVNKKRVREIIREHIVNHRPITGYLIDA